MQPEGISVFAPVNPHWRKLEGCADRARHRESLGSWHLVPIEIEIVREKHRVGQERQTKRCQTGRETHLLPVLALIT